jgi:sRNA-binding carbon storage regulator CsrA
MTVISRQVDQEIVIGDHLIIAPTDIDPEGVRLIARGQYVGGARDGERFQSAHELARGQSLSLGPLITLTLTDILGGRARFAIFSPPHLPALRREVYDRQRKG